MTKQNIRTIMISTKQFFAEREIPQVYTLIQEYRAGIERQFTRQISLDDAIYAWCENIFTPLMEEMEKNNGLALLFRDTSIQQLFFKLNYKMLQLGTNIPHEASLSLIEENAKGLKGRLIKAIA